MGRLNARGLARLRGVLQGHVDEGRIPGAIAVVALGGPVEMSLSGTPSERTMR